MFQGYIAQHQFSYLHATLNDRKTAFTVLPTFILQFIYGFFKTVDKNGF